MSKKIVLKTIMVGESSVGKTSICKVIANGSFEPTSATVGGEFMSFERKYEDKTITVSMFDTSGEERFHSIPRSYYRNVQAVIMVYDVSRKQTFDQLQYWIKDVNENHPISSTDDYDNNIIICVGNKIDLPREVTREEAAAFTKRYNMIYTETSAKTSEGIDDLINEMVAKALENNSGDDNIHKNEQLSIEDPHQTAEGSYCC